MNMEDVVKIDFYLFSPAQRGKEFISNKTNAHARLLYLLPPRSVCHVSLLETREPGKVVASWARWLFESGNARRTLT